MEGEFPYWQPVMALRIIVVVFLVIPLTLFLSGSVILTFMVTKALHRPVNLVHVSLLTELLLVKFAVQILGLFVFPDAVRYCICLEIINDFYVPFTAFNIAFVSVMFTCLSVVQFLIVKGQKKLVIWKVVGVLVAGSTIYSLLWAFASYLSYKLQGTMLLCTSLCTGVPGSTFSIYTFMLVGLIAAVLVPCLLVTFSTLLWSCVIFKKTYIGGSGQLNRRIVSLPAIMPLVTVFTSVLYFILRELIQMVLRRFVTRYYPNWVIVGGELVGYFLEGASGFIYPIILLYIHPQLQSAWKSMLKHIPAVLYRKCLRKSNIVRVQPMSGVSDTATGVCHFPDN